MGSWLDGRWMLVPGVRLGVRGRARSRRICLHAYAQGVVCHVYAYVGGMACHSLGVRARAAVRRRDDRWWRQPEPSERARLRSALFMVYY